jgi:hypothetical protein
MMGMETGSFLGLGQDGGFRDVQPGADLGLPGRMLSFGWFHLHYLIDSFDFYMISSNMSHVEISHWYNMQLKQG